MNAPKFDIESVMEGLVAEMRGALTADVWPGGHRFPPILDPGEPVFAWVDGKAVPIASAEDRA
jgi:hypothetical protein